MTGSEAQSGRTDTSTAAKVQNCQVIIFPPKVDSTNDL